MNKQSNANIARALLSELKNGKSMKKMTTSLAAYLTQERRHNDAQAIVREVERILLAEEGKLYVHATSAFPINAKQKSQITDMLKKHSEAKEIIIQETIDPDVIGGVRLQTADNQLDLTIERQLQRLKHAGQAYSA